VIRQSPVLTICPAFMIRSRSGTAIEHDPNALSIKAKKFDRAGFRDAGATLEPDASNPTERLSDNRSCSYGCAVAVCDQESLRLPVKHPSSGSTRRLAG
jgi:hypothetical protein